MKKISGELAITLTRDEYELVRKPLVQLVRDSEAGELERVRELMSRLDIAAEKML